MNTDKLKQLAECRLAVNDYRKQMEDLLNAVQKSPEFIALSGTLAAYQKEITVLTEEIKEAALDEYIKTGNKQLPGVTVKVLTSYVCTDVNAARKYALEKDQTFLQVDWKSMQAEAKQLHGTKYAFPFYRQSMEPQAQIKADLTEFLHEEPQSSPA